MSKPHLLSKADMLWDFTTWPKRTKFTFVKTIGACSNGVAENQGHIAQWGAYETRPVCLLRLKWGVSNKLEAAHVAILPHLSYRDLGSSPKVSFEMRSSRCHHLNRSCSSSVSKKSLSAKD
jgi:hypothetical protein